MKTINGNGFKVKVIKSSRRKTMALKVKDQNVAIHIPSLLPISVAQDFIDKKSLWIQAKLHQQSQQVVIEKQFEQGERFILLGKPYSLSLQQAASKPTLSLSGDNIVCHLQLDKKKQSAIRAAFITWYKQQATNYLHARCNQLSKQTGLSAKSIEVKTYRARWGSCTLSGDIQFNWKLIMAPPDVIDYVIIHELCHTRHHNHSANFWQLVARCMPDYQTRRNWLKMHGYSLEL